MNKTTFDQAVIRLGYTDDQLPEITRLALLLQEGMTLAEGKVGDLVILEGAILTKAREKVLQLLEQALAESKDLGQIATDIKKEYGLGR